MCSLCMTSLLHNLIFYFIFSVTHRDEVIVDNNFDSDSDVEMINLPVFANNRSYWSLADRRREQADRRRDNSRHAVPPPAPHLYVMMRASTTMTNLLLHFCFDKDSIYF